jgi:NAD(P)-dependent dehydrogenase (short-subunit alcohol dehydrogenase family)
MSKRIALISGANKGIGKEVARQLGHAGFTVLIGSRDLKRGEAAAAELKADGVDAEAIQLDVTDSKSVDAAAGAVESKFGKLDALVNNAGIAIDAGTGFDTNVDLVRSTLETNFIGPFQLTKAMAPLLKKSENARVVNVSSTLGSLTRNSDPNLDFSSVKFVGYNCSKSALNMFTIITADYFKDSKVKVNSACPGYVATDLNKHQGHRTVEQGATAIVKLATLKEDGPSGGYFNEDGPIPW